MSASQTERVLIKGNEAVAFGAVDAGCRCYFGYPITPQNEIPEALSVMLPENGGRFVQAESEVAASNMLLGAAAGCVLYFWAFRGIFRPLWGFWTGAAASMAALLARPARFALKTAKKIGRFLKKHFHFLRRCATMKLYRWRFHRMQRSSEEGKGRNVRAKEKEDRQAP